MASADDKGGERRGPFDTALLKRRRARGRVGPDFLLRHAGEELLFRLADLAREETVPQAPRMLAAAPGWLAADIRAALPQAKVITLDWLAPAGGDVVANHPALPFADETFDVVLVLFDAAFVNDLPGAFTQWRRVLRPGGRLLQALPGGETLTELRAAFALAERKLGREPGWRVAPFLDVQKLAQLAGLTGFAEVVTDVERLRVRYADALSLMEELRACGWSNPLKERPRTPMTRGLLARAAALYELRFVDADSRLPATFELLYLTAARPPAPK